MSYETYPSQRFFKVGSKQTVWPTEVAVGAGDEALVTKSGDPALKQAYKSYLALGRIMPTGGRLGAKEAVDFSPEFDMNYLPGVIGSWIGSLYGSTGLPDPLFVVSAANNKINFKEGAGAELTGTLASGSYNATALCAAIKTAMDDAAGSALVYTVTFSATTKKFTIAAPSTISLLWFTGANKTVDISTMCGYSDAADDTGASSYVADTVAIGSAYVHTFQWANFASPAFTVAETLPGVAWVVPAAIPMKLSFSVADGLLHGAITLRGNDVIATSSLNNDTNMATITPEAEADLDFVNFQEGVALLNTQAGDALDSGDAVELSDLNADFERAMSAKIVMGASQIANPKESGFNIGLKVRFPDADAVRVAYLASFIAITAMKMAMTFSGRVISGTHAYGLSLYFPRLKFTGPPDVKHADLMDAGAEFIAEEAVGAVNGMSYLRPYLTITNTRPTAYTT